MCVILELEIVLGTRCELVACYIKAEFVLCVEVCVGELSIQFCVGPADCKSDSREHVISGDPVDVVLIDFRPYYDPVVVRIHASFLGCPPSLDVLCPTSHIFVLWNVINVVHVRIY